MSYQLKCNFCGTFLSEKRKDNDTGKWIVKNLDGKPHEYRECKAIQANRPQQKSYQPNHQARISTASPAPSSTFSRDEDVPKAQGVTIFSLHVTISELRKEVKELRKQIETLASITDSTAQKTELLINKVGYPAPQPALSPEREKLLDECAKPNEPEIKAQQRHPTQEELANAFKVTPTEVINPMRVAKEEGINRMEEIITNDVMQWQNISEAFICHNCSGKCHNGYTKLGTKLCPNCKDSVESNESEDGDRSDVNNYKPRSIEDINDDL